jgi:hypothetical protein
MAGTRAILKALWHAVRRDLHSYHSLTANNFFLFAMLVAYQQAQSALFFGLVMGLLLLFPLAADPLAKIPRERMEAWPLTEGGRVVLRVGSMGLSPAAWITVGLVFGTSHPVLGVAFLLLAAAIHGLTILARGLAARAPQWNVPRWVPRLPGRLGGLVHQDLRQMLAMLDLYLALVVSVAGTAWRIAGRNPDPEAFPILALIVVLSLSTYAQCLFGLDIESGWTRYRMLPVSGWYILLAKGLAFLLVAVLLVLPLDPLAGLAAAFAALAVGQQASVQTPVPQHRWRFNGGTLFPNGLVQVVAIFGAGLGVHRQSIVWLPAAAAVYAVSLWYYGRAWDREVG